MSNQFARACEIYLSHLDPHKPNAENIQTYFRGLVLTLTLKVLNEEPAEDGTDAPFLFSSNNPQEMNPAWNDEHEQAYQEQLSRRSKARMEAFLSGCRMAAGEEDDLSLSSSTERRIEHVPWKRQTNKKISNRKLPPTSPRGAEANPSIKDGLSGFQTKNQLSSSPKNSPSPIMTSVRNQSQTLMKSISSTGSTGKIYYPQIDRYQLALRLELYIRSLVRVRSSGDECVIASESPRAIKARAQCLVHAFVETAGCVRSIAPCLTRLLHAMTKEVLAVDNLPPALRKVIRHIVNEYEHSTSFASLAFLSTPESAADTRLTPLVLKYLKYVQSKWEQLVRDCELERMLSLSIDAETRHFFKNVEFRSIGHLLEICQQHKSKLQGIELPPQQKDDLIHSNAALKQALRDLQREVITVNGHVLPPVSSRKDLIYILTQTLNSRALTAEPRRSLKFQRRASKRKSKKINEVVDPTVGGLSSDGMLSSEMDDEDEAYREEDGDVQPRGGRQRRSFHLSTVDLLTRRLLLATSRTGTGGDAYFCVRDLFGGEDVEVVPSTPTHGHMAVRPGTIDILVRLADIIIKCHASFDVYPKNRIGECEPLIQFHTTTTETISLQEVRSGDEDSSDDDKKESGDSRPMTIVQERITSKTGWRTLQIRPALYERVEVWNTPS